MTTIMQKQKNFLLRKFHSMLGEAGIDTEGKRAMLSAYGVESSKELDAHQLLDICNKLEYQLTPNAAELDKWRKRLIASIGGWLRALGKEQSITKIKAIACRAAGKKHFNRIGLERLRSLYYAFNKKTKDLAFVDQLTSEELDYLTYIN